jgi:hypothetical protein
MIKFLQIKQSYPITSAPDEISAANDYEIIFKIVLPLLAIIVSVIAVLISVRNAKRQIKIGKIEEISEILNSLKDFYPAIYRLFKISEKIRVAEPNELQKLSDEYDECALHVRQFITPQELMTKINRLRVLTNAYLTQFDIKLNILCTIEMFGHMATQAFTNQYEDCLAEFPKGMPELKKFQDIVEELQVKVIKEMNLGNDYITQDKLTKFDDIFKKQLYK